jgi:hypothetical protein
LPQRGLVGQVGAGDKARDQIDYEVDLERVCSKADRGISAQGMNSTNRESLTGFGKAARR